MGDNNDQRLLNKRKSQLTRERIKAMDRFEMYIVGVGTLDKDSALKEIEALSDVGQALIQIEQRAIEMASEELKPYVKKR